MSQPPRRALLVSALTLLLIVTAGMAAQSGRRAPKTKPAPVPTPEPEAAAAPKPTPTPKPALTLIVGIDSFQGLPYYYVLDSCIDRMDDNRAVKAVKVWGDMSWGEAVRRAKKEQEAYIVRLAVATDTMSGEIDDRDFSVEYAVFTPVTAKIATSGRVYAAAYRAGSVILNPRRSTVYGNHRLIQAGREAAERILSALNHPIPTRPIPAPATVSANTYASR